MPTVKREDISEVSTVVTVEISQADYQQKLKKKLREAQEQTSIKGFRPGQAPANFIRKKFGNGILADLVEEQVREALGKYFQDEKLTYLAQPLPHTSNSSNTSLQH